MSALRPLDLEKRHLRAVSAVLLGAARSTFDVRSTVGQRRVMHERLATHLAALAVEPRAAVREAELWVQSSHLPDVAAGCAVLIAEAATRSLFRGVDCVLPQASWPALIEAAARFAAPIPAHWLLRSALACDLRTLSAAAGPRLLIALTLPSLLDGSLLALAREANPHRGLLKLAERAPARLAPQAAYALARHGRLELARSLSCAGDPWGRWLLGCFGDQRDLEPLAQAADAGEPGAAIALGLLGLPAARSRLLALCACPLSESLAREAELGLLIGFGSQARHAPADALATLADTRHAFGLPHTNPWPEPDAEPLLRRWLRQAITRRGRLGHELPAGIFGRGLGATNLGPTHIGPFARSEPSS